MSMEEIVFEPKKGNIIPLGTSIFMTTINGQGTTSFSFTPPIESPISDYTFEAYVDAIGDSRPPINTSSLVKVAEVLFSQTIATYTGSNITGEEFYNTFIDTNSGSPYPTILQHKEERGVEAWLNIELETTASTTLNRTLRLAPVHETEQDRYERPKVSGGTIEGYVNLGITLEKEEGRNYSNETVIPILEALLTDSDLKLRRNLEIQESNPITEVKDRKRKGLYIRIERPTVERMQDAVEAANLLQTYFKLHRESLQRVASAYEIAAKSDETKAGVNTGFELYVKGPYDDALSSINRDTEQQRP